MLRSELRDAQKNGGAPADSAIPARALLPTDQGSPRGNCIEASIRWTWVARVATSLRVSPYGMPVSTSYRLTMNLATNLRT
jgi:hypothetical protein